MAWSTTTDPLRFDEAADWFLGRIAITKGWYEGLALKWRRYTFTAANLATLQMVSDLQASLLRAMREGKHLREWKAEYLPTLEAQWAGTVKDPGFRASTIYRNALQRSYNTGRWTVHTDPAVMAARPYWMFDAVIDGRETDICRERDGKIVRADDPWWQQNYPPLHHRCRSGVRALRESEAAKRGVTTNPAFETMPQRGFGAAPSADEWDPDPQKMPGKLREVWEKKMMGPLALKPPLAPPAPPPGTPYNPATTPAPAPAHPAKAKKPGRRPKAGAAGEPSGPPPLRDVILGEQIAPATGSNPGGLFRGTDGVVRYVKFYDDRAQAYGEHLANQIYRGLGLESVESVVFELEDGRIGYASRLIDGARTLADAGLTKERALRVLDGFAADVLTANWDVAGADLDNLLVLQNGRLLRVDNGGAFLMRARYGRKPALLLNQLTEWEGFLDPSRNPAYARLAARAGISDPRQLGDDLLRQIDAILELERQAGGWDAFVRLHAPGLLPDDRQAIVAMLEARTTLLRGKRAEIRAWLDATDAARARAALPPTGPTFDATDAAWKDRDLLGSDATAERMWRAARAAVPDAYEALAEITPKWTASYSKDAFQRKLRAQVTRIMNGKNPTTTLGQWARTVMETRLARWRAAAAAIGAEVPGAFRLYRGVKGEVFAQDVYKAWKTGAAQVRVRSETMTSWSFDRRAATSFAAGANASVIFQADVPFQLTFADQLVDDGTFLRRFFTEHEVVVMTPREDDIVADARHTTVRFNGRIYTYDQRHEFIQAWEAAHGPNGYRVPSP